MAVLDFSDFLIPSSGFLLVFFFVALLLLFHLLNFSFFIYKNYTYKLKSAKRLAFSLSLTLTHIGNLVFIQAYQSL